MPRRRCESRNSGRSHGGKAGPQMPSCQSGKMEKKLGTASEEQGQKIRASRGHPSCPDQVLHYQGRKLGRPMRSCVDSVKKDQHSMLRTVPTPEGCCPHHTSGPSEGAGYQLPEASNLTETLISLHPDNIVVKCHQSKALGLFTHHQQGYHSREQKTTCQAHYRSVISAACGWGSRKIVIKGSPGYTVRSSN